MFFAIVRTMLRTTECDDITQDDAVFSRRQVIGAQNAALLPTARNCSTQLQHATCMLLRHANARHRLAPRCRRILIMQSPPHRAPTHKRSGPPRPECASRALEYHMTARPSLKRSATLNFIGGILPMFVALVT